MGRKRLEKRLGDTPRVVEMQSEAGAIATVHGALQTGALSTSFTSSQGLLLMIPTLYKLAGELTPFVLHVAARTVATHTLYWRSFRRYGGAPDGLRDVVCSKRPEAQDFALISHIATLKAACHLFISLMVSAHHEINKIVPLADDTILELMPQAKLMLIAPGHSTRNIR